MDNQLAKHCTSLGLSVGAFAIISGQPTYCTGLGFFNQSEIAVHGQGYARLYYLFQVIKGPSVEKNPWTVPVAM